MATPASNEVQNIFGYIKESGEGSQRLLIGAQNALLQTRQLQLQEQAQVFNQSLNLRKQDFMEKQQVFENGLANKRLDIQLQGVLWDDALNAAKLESIESLTALRNAQAAKQAAEGVVSPYLDIPYGGSGEAYLQRFQNKKAGGEAVAMSWAPEIGTALQETQAQAGPAPSKPILTERDASPSGGLPLDDGSAASDSLFDLDPLPPLTMGIGLNPPAFTIPRDNPQQAAAATIAQASAESKAPRSNFDLFMQSMNDVYNEIEDSEVPVTQKMKMLQRVRFDQMRIASTDYKDDPAAQTFIAQSAPNASAIYSSLVSGDTTRAGQLYKESMELSGGYLDPVTAKAWQDGNLVLANQREAKLKREEFSDLLKAVSSDMFTNNFDTETRDLMKKRLRELTIELHGSPAANPADADEPR